ncbi:MAG TPA: serine/threonine-protein kinase, partial [Burkholderiales bacterium]|nr:serine/threonine-protein kinase [Burkholderiales bacterium]
MNADIALPRGYSLNEYRIESTLGIGGFGLTYLATDANLNLKVAIKEYLPGELALRCDDQSVRSKSASTLETFNWGRTRFLEESRTLASFRHPNIVRVMRFFEANQTAYMVMEFVEGQALGEWLPARRPLTEQALKALALPVLDGLEVIHGAGFLHRDIKPGNIFMRNEGGPVLLDFGSARVTSANTEMTAIVSPGYAPLEQYHTNGHQGPWSDLYALGAVLYWVVTGTKPVEATARARNDPLPPAAQIGDHSRYSLNVLKAIDWALTPSEEARPQSVAELRKAMHSAAPVSDAAQATIFVPAPSVSGP